MAILADDRMPIPLLLALYTRESRSLISTHFFADSITVQLAIVDRKQTGSPPLQPCGYHFPITIFALEWVKACHDYLPITITTRDSKRSCPNYRNLNSFRTSKPLWMIPLVSQQMINVGLYCRYQPNTSARRFIIHANFQKCFDLYLKP